MNDEYRDNARFDHEATILIENYPKGSYYHAKMFNYSEGGMYFESNIPFRQGTIIIFGIENSPFEDCPGVYKAKVKWCKKLADKSAIYYYGVGAEFFKPNRLSSKIPRKIMPQQKRPAGRHVHQRGVIDKSEIGRATAPKSTGSLFRNSAQYSRKHPRKPFSKNINYTANKKFYEGLVKDISRGGMFIKSEDKFTVGQELKLTIPSAGRLKNLTLRGAVVRIGKEGFGVKFKRMLKS
jgi:Tfp pilus assembly protein PilZ